MKTNAATQHLSLRERNARSNGSLMKIKLRKGAISIIRGLLMFGLCFMIIQPLITRFCTSIMEEKDLYDSTIILLPRNTTLQNFRDAFEMLEMPVSLFNSMWVSMLVSICQIISCTLVAYGFARHNFPLKKLWFACTVALIIIPPQTIATSLVSSFSNFDIFGIFTKFTGKPLNLKGSLLPYTVMSLTCMGLKNGLYIYMLRQYFRGVPKSLEEAAYIDGCNTLRTFTNIMLPDAVPIILSCFLFSFVWQVTDIFYSRNFLSGLPIYSVKLSTLVSSMAYFFSQQVGTAVVIPAARSQQFISIGVVICSTPLIILYLLTQKTFVKSLAMTGSKE